MKKWGKKIYVVAADYNYGQITSQVGQEVRPDNGGEVVSIEFFPLDVTNFGVDDQEDPGREARHGGLGPGRRGAHLVLPAVGRRRHEQEIPLASTTFGVGNEQIVLSPKKANGIWSAYNYFEECRHTRQQGFPRSASTSASAPTTPMSPSSPWGLTMGIQALGRGRQEGRRSIDRLKVIDALETGISIDGPSGKV